MKSLFGLAIAGIVVFLSSSTTFAATNDQAIAGTWALRQCSTPQELTGATWEINNALSTPRLRGFSFRTTWKAIDTNFNILNSAKALADAKGLAFAPRFMAGRHTPARVFDNGAAYLLTAENEKYPRPFLADGSANTIFEQEYEGLIARLAEWSRSNGVREVHCSWYAMAWAELNHGTDIRSAQGYTYQRFVDSHKRLMDIALKYAGADLAFEFPFSGHGPLTDVANDFADYIVGKIGPWNPIFFCQANGWGTSRDWGSPNDATEAAFDVVWTKPIMRGEQSIQPQDYDWTKCYNLLYRNKATYCEVYTPSFNNNQPHKAVLVQEIAKFADYVESLNGNEDPTPENVNIDEAFNVTSWAKLDDNGANNESVRHAFDTTASAGSDYVWGAYAAPGGTGTSQIGFAAANDTLIFNPGAVVAGSRAYTRFDTSAGTTGAKNAPSVVVNAAEDGAKIELTVFDNPHANLQINVLLRDSQTWWRSSPLPVAVSNTPQTIAFNFSGDAAVTWTALDKSAGGGADMDQVNNLGEGALTTSTPGAAINFAAVSGMGVEIHSVGTPGSSDLQISGMQLVAPLPLPAKAQGNWSEYR